MFDSALVLLDYLIHNSCGWGHAYKFYFIGVGSERPCVSALVRFNVTKENDGRVNQCLFAYSGRIWTEYVVSFTIRCIFKALKKNKIEINTNQITFLKSEAYHCDLHRL
jgi:hypothetical protein